ncbi:MAG: SCO family protein [Pseudomonadota bacterium]
MVRFIISLIILISCIYAVHAREPMQKSQQELKVAQVINKPTTGLAKIGGRFFLKDHKGALRKDTDFRGKYMLVYFGYSFCPDICPQALFSMTEALGQLGKKAGEIVPIFITVDPHRDTQIQLDTYRQNFHPNLVTLTGTSAQVKQAMKSYRVYAAKVKPDGTLADYLVDHSSIIYLMDRQGRFISHFNHATPPEEISAMLKTLP